MVTHSLAQLRAQHALAAITTLVEQGPQHYGNYLGYVKALPANIRSLGLGQALAFLLSKAAGEKKPPGNDPLTTPHGLLYAHVTGWLLGRSIYAPDTTSGNFMVRLIEGSQDDYLRAQIEAMAYLEWLKKFATAMLVKQDAEAE